MSTPTGSDGAHSAREGGRAPGGATPAATPATGQAHGRPVREAQQDRLSVHHGRPGEERSLDRKSVVERERDAHGGIKVGSAFFGWLTATGTAVLLTALLAATGTAVGLATTNDVGAAVDSVTQQAAGDAATIGVVGAIALLVVLLVSYFCGGYVAGRMARFDGAKQGIAVWAWAVVIAVVVAVLAAVAGSRFDVLGQLNAFPRIPVDAASLTGGSIIALVAAALVSLLGAVLGGLAGMRFHRRVDKAGLGR